MINEKDALVADGRTIYAPGFSRFSGERLTCSRDIFQPNTICIPQNFSSLGQDVLKELVK